ncbi:MAG: germination protein YpeB [Clostridia bacterium]|nr:germination protein YpeB [Clostridia bacterium]
MRRYTVILAVLLCLSLGVNAAQSAQNRRLSARISTQNQREMSDVLAAMADIEVNLSKLLIASGAQQSVTLLGETALLAQHVESGLSRLPLRYETASGAMKFAGQIGDYVMTLAAQVSGGGMLTSGDERQLSQLLDACHAFGEHLAGIGEQMAADPTIALADEGIAIGAAEGEEAEGGEGSIEYPSLIYDGPFSDGRVPGKALALTGERLTRERARQAAAQYAGTTSDRVTDAADSGGQFEAFGFTADTDFGRLSVQVTGQGGHLLWMMPEQAEFAVRLGQDECLRSALVWLADSGFGEMEPCFVQQYDGMVVANFASVQEGVLLYPDQVKVQVSMESGTVVGAECTQYLTNHTLRSDIAPKIDEEDARQMISERLEITASRLCVIPQNSGERLCWEFAGLFGGTQYRVYIDAKTGETAEILCVAQTADGETAI